MKKQILSIKIGNFSDVFINYVNFQLIIKNFENPYEKNWGTFNLNARICLIPTFRFGLL